MTSRRYTAHPVLQYFIYTTDGSWRCPHDGHSIPHGNDAVETAQHVRRSACTLSADHRQCNDHRLTQEHLHASQAACLNHPSTPLPPPMPQDLQDFHDRLHADPHSAMLYHLHNQIVRAYESPQSHINQAQASAQHRGQMRSHSEQVMSAIRHAVDSHPHLDEAQRWTALRHHGILQTHMHNMLAAHDQWHQANRPDHFRAQPYFPPHH